VAVGASVGGTWDGTSTLVWVAFCGGPPVHPTIRIMEISRRIIRCFLNIMDIVT
jgi:hypothetical protein